mgnify:CR=1 FL=1
MEKRHIIEADKPLSQSLLWQIQRAYFLQAGMTAWQDNVVPSDISSNPVMARAYSRIVFGYLHDCFAAAQQGDFALDPGQPINIVELGAGSGRLAYHFLQTFLPRYQQSPFAGQPIRYIMTDFVPQILEFWQGHGRFQPYIDAGILDFGLFDVMKMRPFALRNSGQLFAPDPDTVQNPVILIANYFFDSIPQDSFVIEDGLLCQNLLTLTSSQAEPDLGDPAIWQRLALHYEPIPLEKSFYEEPLYNQILDDYEAALPEARFSFPNVGLDCLQYWCGFGDGRLLILTSDRGYTLPDSLLNQPDPLPNLHGSFSLMVNYHAISEYISRSGGIVCRVPHYQDNIQVLAYVLGQIPQRARKTQLAFAGAVEEGSPDDFHALKRVVEKQYATMSLPELLSFLRLSGWDTAIFADCLPHFRDRVLQADPIWHGDVVAALHNIQERYLPLREPDTLLTEIEQLLSAVE